MGAEDTTFITARPPPPGPILLAVVDHVREIAESREAFELNIEAWRLADKAAG